MSARCHAMFPLCGCAPPEKPARAPRVTKVHSEDSHASSHAAPPAAGSAFAGSSDSLPANQAEALTAPSAPDHETVDLGDMPPDDEEGSEHKVVYFIANEAITKVKIGKTKSIKTRLKNSQTFSPEPLHLLCTVPGYTAVETWFHRRFAEHHLHLEWFRLDGELARCISRIKGGLSTDEICPEALHRDGGPAPAAPEDEWAHLSDDDLELQEEIEMLAARLRRADAEAGRRSLAEFTRQCFVNAYKPDEPLQWGPHLDAVCLHVEMQLRDRARARSDWRFTMRAQNLIINVPPRSLKTFILACAQVWCWLHWPSTIILYCSANPIVVTDSSRVFDSIIRSPWFQTTYEPAWSLMPGHDALTDCGNTMKGERKAKGLDSKVTGAGCDWLIVDDPHDMKDNAGAIATTVANYDAAQANRLNNPRTSIRTFIAQRANDPNDLCGHLIDQMVGGGNKVLRCGLLRPGCDRFQHVAVRAGRTLVVQRLRQRVTAVVRRRGPAHQLGEPRGNPRRTLGQVHEARLDHAEHRVHAEILVLAAGRALGQRHDDRLTRLGIDDLARLHHRAQGADRRGTRRLVLDE